MKQSLQFPLGLNLAHNDLHVDKEWTTFEHCNAPFINNMYMPLYKSESDIIGPTAFDATGNKYEVVPLLGGAQLNKNTVKIGSLSNKKFKKTQIDLSEYLAWDSEDAWLKFNDINNTIECSNGFTSSSLFDSGSIIGARVRKINDHIYGIVYYINDTGSQKALLICNNDTYSKEVKWYRQFPRLTSNAAYNPTQVTGIYSSPLIQIAELNNVPVFTMVSNYGQVLASDEQAFTQFAVYNNAVYDTSTIRPANQTFSGEVTNTTINTFVFSDVTSSVNGNKVGYRRLVDGQYEYYDDEWNAIEPPAAQVWYETGNTATHDGNEYSEVATQTKVVTKNVTATCTSDNTLSFTATAKINNEEVSAVSSSGSAVITKTIEVYSTEDTTLTLEDLYLTWDSETTNVPQAYWYGALFSVTRTSTQIVTNLTYAIAPNIFLDDGTIYAFYAFNVTTANWNANAIAAGLTIVDSARFDAWSISGSNLIYSFIATEYTSVNSNARAIISNSFTVGQNFFSNTTKMGGNGNTPSTASSAGVNDNNKFLEWTNSNCNDKRFWPGTTPYTNKNYNGLTGWEDGLMTFTVQGYRTPLNNSKWNLLYNTRESGSSIIQGISYSNNVNEAGILLTEWQSVDASFPVAYGDTWVIYRDNDKKYWKIEIVDGTDILSVLDNRLVLLNTTSYYNCYDSELGVMLHAFTDFNNRVVYGTSTLSIKSGAATVNRVAEAINNLYSIQPRLLISSNNEGVISRYRCELSDPKVYRYVCPESAFIQPIDIFYQTDYDTTIIAANYQYSIISEAVQTRKVETNLIGTVYQVRVGEVSPSLWVKLVSGTGNTDMALEGTNAYKLVYDVDTPVFLYDVSSTLTDVDAMFILQGQYYAVIHNKIYSLIYSNGTITEMDAIVEIRGFKYIGSTTSIAFFYSDRMRAIYSFTGDANLQHIFDASKIAEIYTFLNGSSYIYDESTQSIYIPTNTGLLVFGPKNTYLLEDIIRPSMIYFTDDTLWHIVSDDNITTFSYYYREGFVSNKVILETEFFGIGDTESTSIDKWNIKLFTQTGDADNVKLSVRSITDITTKSEDKVLPIPVNAWDKWSKAVLISYAPTLIKGAGIRIRIETDNAVESITPHIMDNNTGTLTRRQA